VGRKRVERLMRAAGLAGYVKRRKGRTTVRVAGVRPAEDLVERHFVPAAPNQIWMSDIKEGPDHCLTGSRELFAGAPFSETSDPTSRSSQTSLGKPQIIDQAIMIRSVVTTIGARTHPRQMTSERWGPSQARETACRSAAPAQPRLMDVVNRLDKSQLLSTEVSLPESRGRWCGWRTISS
jgi:hypothetical protein